MLVLPCGCKLVSSESTSPNWLRRVRGFRLLRIFSSKVISPTGSC